MKRFLRDILLFLTVPATALLLWLAWNIIVGTTVSSRLERIAQNKVLIMGDSQMQRLDPAGFSSTAYNLASSAEHYYFTLQKLRTITSFNNHNVETVVLGLSAHTFSPTYTRLFDPGEAEGRQSIRYYRHFTHDDAFLKMRHLTDIRVLRSAALAKPEWGGYRTSAAASPDTATLEQIFEMHYGGTDTVPCASQRYWLGRIVELCRSSNIRLVLVSTPYHPWYYERTERKYFGLLEDVVAEYTGRIEYVNFLRPPVSPSLMSDANHLNATGAAIYTRLINEIIMK